MADTFRASAPTTGYVMTPPRGHKADGRVGQALVAAVSVPVHELLLDLGSLGSVIQHTSASAVSQAKGGASSQQRQGGSFCTVAGCKHEGGTPQGILQLNRALVTQAQDVRLGYRHVVLNLTVGSKVGDSSRELRGLQILMAA